MTQKIYLGNLPFETTEEGVRHLCTPFGPVQSVSMITDRDTGRFRGFCFVEMKDAHAAAAIAALNGKKVGGRKIKANKARSRGKKQQRKQSGKESGAIPLHERTNRGGFGAHDDRFPHSGGTRGSRGRGNQERNRDSSDFPNSGGRTRR